VTWASLADSHVLAIVDGLSTYGSHLHLLDLESNPGISAQGYGALFNLINRTNVIEHVSLCKWDEPDESCVDKSAWEGKLNLVSEMNFNYCRLEYMANATFTSKERKWQWLKWVASLPRPYNNEEEWDAKHLNFIWYTLWLPQPRDDADLISPIQCSGSFPVYPGCVIMKCTLLFNASVNL
jgi:hypothetical protein